MPVIGKVDVPDPARTSFVVEQGFAIEPGSTSGRVDLLEVPAGQRAVVEQSSARCYSPLGNPVVEAYVSVIVAILNGATSARFQIPLSFQGSTQLNGPTYAGNLTTRLYADRGGVISGGNGVIVFALRATPDGRSICTMSISGHFVKL